jgi:hypothetical protein
VTDAMEIAASIEARIQEFEAAMNGVLATSARVIAATEALERDMQLAFLNAMRDEIDVAIRELSEPQPEPVA